MTEISKSAKQLTAAEKRSLLIQLLQQKEAKQPYRYRPSYGQSSLWFIQQLNPESAAYNESFAWRLKAQLTDEDGLEIAKIVSQRHPILRTTYQLADGKPQAIIHPSIPLDFESIDAHGWDDDRLRAGMQEHANRPIDLLSGPVIRLRLFRGKEELAWLTTIHHIAIDLASMIILMEDIKLILACKMTGQPIPASSSLPYDHFAAWQREFVESEAGIRQRDFWLKLLSGFESLKLPSDFPPKLAQHAPGSNDKIRLRRSLTSELVQLAKDHNTTLYGVLLSAFQILLGRYSSQDKFLLGSVVSGRTQTKYERSIGLYANPIAIPTDQSDNPTFSQYLQHNRQLLASILANQDYPYSMLVEQLSRKNDGGRSPLVTATFLLQTQQRTGLQDYDPYAENAASAKGLNSSIAGVSVEVLPVHQQHAKFELFLEMISAGDELMGTLHYDAGRFQAATIEILIDSFMTLLESIVADPNELIHRLAMIGPKSKAILASDELNRTSTPQSFETAFQSQVHQRPDAVAIEDRLSSWNFRELNHYILRINALLEKAEVNPGSVVAIHLPRSKEAIAVMLACWSSGRTSVFFDPSYPVGRLRYILADARPKVIISAKKFENAIAEILMEADEVFAGNSTIWFDEIADQNPTQKFSAGEPTQLNVAPDPETPAYLIYTSGSTGQPKGVAIPHRGLNNVWSGLTEVMGIVPTDRILQTVSFSFDVSIGDIVCALGNGAALVLADSAQIVGQDLWDSLCNSKSTITILSPSVLATLPKRFLPDLRLLLVGSEECGRDLVQHWSAGRQMYNGYGPSETSVCVTLQHCQPDSRKPAIGRPIPNVRVYVMDRLMQPLPVGALGEICIGGLSVGLGYLNQPELNREKFVPDPFSTCKQGRLYRSGDIGRWRADGSLEFHGRRDQQVKLRGMRVELEEIEHALLDSADVRQVAVAAGKEFRDQVVAFLVEKPSVTVDCDALQESLRSRLPVYMLPSCFIKLAEIPTNLNSKIDRQALARIWNLHVQQQDALARTEYVAPRSELERQVAQAFCDVLQSQNVGIYDDFFELGGHSLMAAELADKLRPLATVPIPLFVILGNPTVAGIASALSGDISANTSTDLDLSQEAELDDSIRPTGAFSSGSPASKILLTGATGFLGAHLLNELLRTTQADIHCLVRSNSGEEAIRRILKKQTSLGLTTVDHHRIRPELGDLAEPWLGLGEARFGSLAEELNVIYHNGALVNFSLPYRQLRAANVLGTQNVLRLACLVKTKPVHYVSTISVFPLFSLVGDVVYDESDPLTSHQNLLDGYSQSKWVADKLVKEAGLRGLPYTISRPGRITGDSRSGIGEAEDLLWSAVRQCLLIGAVPTVDTTIDMTPVDYVSQAIVQIGSNPAAWNRAYHLVNPQPLAWERLIAMLRERGNELKDVTIAEWKQLLQHKSQDQKLISLLAMFPEELLAAGDHIHLSRTIYGAQNALNFLTPRDIPCPPADDRLVGMYLDQLGN